MGMTKYEPAVAPLNISIMQIDFLQLAQRK